MRTTVGPDVLDCSRPATLLFWFGIGAVLGITVMSHGAGDWQSLLHVGSRNPLLHRIESEIGPLSTADATGHDGQLYYLIARDPLGNGETPQAIAQLDDNGPRYRYRRILFPLLAGGFGQLGARATLYGMILCLTVAMGLATVALADLSFQLGMRGGAALAATMNAGALVSLLLLTADALALALALCGISLTLRSRTGWAVVAFALAALTKEVYLLVPWALAAWTWKERQRDGALALALLPVLPVAAWSGWVALSLPDTTTTARNIGVPLVGFFYAISIWLRDERNPVELFLAMFAVLTFLTASVMLTVGRSNVLRWLILPWLALGCFSTVKVWGKPNNAARVFAILWPLTVLLMSEWLTGWRKRTTALSDGHSAPEAAYSPPGEGIRR